MVKKCIYCGSEVSNESVIDFCDICGEKVWGKKMLNAIKQNMEDARSNGDLCHQNLFTGDANKFEPPNNFS
jgi:uncharacterized UBP type Zn finger protein